MSQQPTLTILDVGHGNAAVLKDHNGVVVFDSGRGQHLRRFLKRNSIKTIDALVLSHADADHCGGAISVLRDSDLHVKRVYLNPDPTKTQSESHKQLRLATVSANRERHTLTETQLTTTLTGRLDHGDVHVEVLYPSPELTMSGVGGVDLSGRTISSNSLSAAIRLLYQGKPVVFLGADIEFVCLEALKQQASGVLSKVLIFPHHGGLPGTAVAEDARTFAYEVGRCVQPAIVVFSINRTRHELPRQEVTDGLAQAVVDVRFVCTQLPQRIKDIIRSPDPGPWVLHRKDHEGTIVCDEGDILVVFNSDQTAVFICAHTPEI